MDKNELIIKIIDILVWPLILVGFLIFYRKVVKVKLLGLKSAKVSADGGEFLFREIQTEVKNETKKIESRPASLEPTGRGTEPKGRGVSNSKETEKPKLTKSNLPPYKQLFMINSKVEDYLKSMAKQHNISIEDFESLTMIDQLTEKGLIDLAKRDKLVKITKLIRTVDSSITKEQIEVLKKYYQII